VNPAVFKLLVARELWQCRYLLEFRADQNLWLIEREMLGSVFFFLKAIEKKKKIHRNCDVTFKIIVEFKNYY
jgi:hypothetical protein